MFAVVMLLHLCVHNAQGAKHGTFCTHSMLRSTQSVSVRWDKGIVRHVEQSHVLVQYMIASCTNNAGPSLCSSLPRYPRLPLHLFHKHRITFPRSTITIRDMDHNSASAKGARRRGRHVAISVAGGPLQVSSESNRIGAVSDMLEQPANNFLRLTPIARAPYQGTPSKKRKGLEDDISDAQRSSKRTKTDQPHEYFDRKDETPDILADPDKRKRSEDSVCNIERSPKRVKTDHAHERSKKRKADDTYEDSHDSNRPCRGTNESHSESPQPLIHQDTNPRVEDWYPNWWTPVAIRDSDFFKESGFLLVGGGTALDSYPCLIFDADSFRVLCDTLAAQRKSIAKAKWRDEELDIIDARVETIDRENAQDMETMSALNNVGMRMKDSECDDLLKSVHRIRNEIQAREEERVRLLTQRDAAIEKARVAEQTAFDAFFPLLDTLDKIFGNLGVLPDVDDIAAPPMVPLLEPSVVANATPPAVVPGMGETNTEAASGDLVEVLAQVLRDVGNEAFRVEAEFDRFRDSFNVELHRYIAQEQVRLGSDAPPVAQLEASFGPIWLSRHQAITSRLIEVTKAYYAADRAWTEAKRKRKLTSLENGLQPAEADDPDEVLPGPAFTGASEVENFGVMLPDGARNGIESWLDPDDAASSQMSTQAVVAHTAAPAPAPETSQSGSEDGKLSVAGGWLRAKIDDYERYVGRVSDGESQLALVVRSPDDDTRAELMQQIFVEEQPESPETPFVSNGE